MTVPDWSEWVIEEVPHLEIAGVQHKQRGVFVRVDDNNPTGKANIFIPLASKLEIPSSGDWHDSDELRRMAQQGYDDLIAKEVA